MTGFFDRRIKHSTQEIGLEMWLDPEDKIVSFHPMPGWTRREYESAESVLKELERFVNTGYRFQ